MTQFSLRPVLTALELLCFLAAWGVGVVAMWSSDRDRSGLATGENVAASSALGQIEARLE